MRRALIAMALLAGCSSVQTPTPIPARPTLPAADQDTCQGRQYSQLIGQDATALERVLIMRQVRVLHPDSVMTMDFRAERLNFEVGADSKISGIFCG